MQELEDALRKARADAEHFKKQLTEAHRVAMSQATAAASPLYAHTEALNAAAAASGSSSTSSGHGTSGGTGHGTSSSSISSSTSTLSGLTASSLVTAAMGKQNMIYDNYGSTNNPSQSSAKPRSSVRDIAIFNNANFSLGCNFLHEWKSREKTKNLALFRKKAIYP